MITWDELQPYVGAADSDELMVEAMEAAAVAMLQRETGRYFGPERDTTEFVEGDGSRVLFLQGPVMEDGIESVSERPYPGADATLILEGETDGFILRGDCKLIRAGGLVWNPYFEYEVAYAQGYEAGAEPADVRQAVRDLVRWMFKMQQAGETVIPDGGGAAGVLESETLGDYSYKLADILGSGGSSNDAWKAAVPTAVKVINTWRLLRA